MTLSRQLLNLAAENATRAFVATLNQYMSAHHQITQDRYRVAFLLVPKDGDMEHAACGVRPEEADAAIRVIERFAKEIPQHEPS